MSETQQITRGLIETQRLVDEIRVFLQAMDRTDNDRLRLLAKQYAAACAEVNDRLSRSFYFLRQGLRSEALHLADSPPPVMELLSVLDFTERAEWEDLALQYDWTRPPALAIETAQAMNEAYALEESLKELMSTHRLLALGRAPLSERVATLRAIAKLDPNNTIWQDDIKTLGRARLAKLDEEIKAAEADISLSGLSEIEKELTDPGWGDAPIEPQRKAVKAAKEHVKRILARGAVGKLTNDLLEAYDLQSLEAAQAIRDQWNAKAKEAVLDPKDPFLIKAAPALEWLKLEDFRLAGEAAYHEAVDDLEAALDSKASRAQLEQLERQVNDTGYPVPPETEARLDDYFKSIDRRNRLAIFGLVGGLSVFALACVMIAVWFNAEGQRRQAVEQAVTQIDGFLERDRIVDARQVYQKSVAADPRMADARELGLAEQRISQREDKEKARANKFSSDLRQARADSSLSDQSSEVDELRKMARTSEEIKEIDELVIHLRTERVRNEMSSNDELTKLLRSLEPEVERLGSQMSRNPRSEDIDSEIGRLRKIVSQLRSLGLAAVDPNRSAADRLATRFDKIAEARTALIRQGELDRKITEAIQDDMSTEDLDRIVKLYKAYIDEFASVTRSEGLTKALKRVDRWNAILAWNQLVDEWQGIFTLAKADAAKERRERIDKFLESYPRSPDNRLIEEYKAYLGTVAEAFDTEPTSPLRSLFVVFDNNPLFTNVYVLEVKDEKKYYSKGMPVPEGGLYRYTSLNDQALLNNQLGAQSVPIRDVIGVPTLSPHSKIAEFSRKSLEKIDTNPATWERVMSSILGQIRNSKEMDSILKVILLKQVMIQSSRGNYGLAVALKEELAAIEDAKIDPDAKWMDPDDGEAKVYRINARAVIERLGSFDQLALEAKTNRENLQNNVFELYRPVGWLALDETNHWQRLGPTTTNREELWIATTDDRWVKLGTQDSLRKLSGISAKVNQEALYEGCLVFARRSKHRP